MTTIPASYQREGGSKLLGCLVYLVVAPFVALFLALFLTSPVLLAVEHFRLPKELAAAYACVVVPLIVLGVAVFGYRDYRRRAALEVVIDWDRVVIELDGRQTVVLFEDVASIRFVPTRDDFACVFMLSSGRALSLPPEVAPFQRVRDVLERTLIRKLVRRLDERMARGDTLTLRLPVGRMVLAMLRAIGALVISVFMLVKPTGIPAGYLLVRHAATVMQQCWLGIRGGVVLQREGLRAPSHPDEPVTSWSHLERVRSDPIGLILRSREGRVFAVSSLSEGFWPALRWINARVN